MRIRRNFRVLKEIGVEEHDDDVRFFTRNGNTTVSRMRNASGHNYWNSSFIMDVTMGPIPRSTERISSCVMLSFEYSEEQLLPHQVKGAMCFDKALLKLRTKTPVRRLHFLK